MRVTCINNSGYYNLSEGKEYELVVFTPQLHTPNFTFPNYVTVIDDNGEKTTGHAYRFKMPDGMSCDDYMRENIPENMDREYLEDYE